MQKNNLPRAKGLFEKAVLLEEHNNRLNGAAIDYVNIALIEKKCGNQEQAKKTLKLALEYAEGFDDEKLSTQIKNMIKENC